MKKLIVSSIAAAALTTTAMADTKIGIGADLMMGDNGGSANGKRMLRVSLDGVIPGRLDIRTAYMSNTPNGGTASTGTAFGVGYYGDLGTNTAWGVIFDSTDMSKVGGNKNTFVAGVVKAETEVAKNFALGYEIGLGQTAVDGGATTLAPYSALTARLFF